MMIIQPYLACFGQHRCFKGTKSSSDVCRSLIITSDLHSLTWSKKLSKKANLLKVWFSKKKWGGHYVLFGLYMALYLCSICNFHFAINALGSKISPPLTNEVWEVAKAEGKKCFQPFAKTSPASTSPIWNSQSLPLYWWVFKLIEMF